MLKKIKWWKENIFFAYCLPHLDVKREFLIQFMPWKDGLFISGQLPQRKRMSWGLVSKGITCPGLSQFVSLKNTGMARHAGAGGAGGGS